MERYFFLLLGREEDISKRIEKMKNHEFLANTWVSVYLLHMPYFFSQGISKAFHFFTVIIIIKAISQLLRKEMLIKSKVLRVKSVEES